MSQTSSNSNRALPKIVLHDHIDGGLRPATVIELASAVNYSGLPTVPRDVGRFFEDGAAGSLVEYLTLFEHTVAVMQTPEAIRRVAFEAIVDLAADGVVYGELRLAPSQHLELGMTREQVIEATLEGLEAGAQETGMAARLIVSAMRDREDGVESARAATQFTDGRVAGFDLAGPELGFPARDHMEALRIASNAGLHLTIHAGEGAGVDSVQDALECGSERIGHGVRIVEDIGTRDGYLSFGATADCVLRKGIALELCLKSELDTRAVASAASHPIDLLQREGFVTTINTDNRLMSMTDMTYEFDLLARHKGFGHEDFRTLTLNAVESAFCDASTKDRIGHRVNNEYDRLAAT
jgi:adenosine deaminase